MVISKNITIGSFPYAPGGNPYQRLFTESIEQAGLNVNRISPKKWFPLQSAILQPCDILHLDWPHDWYNGKNLITKILKTGMYLDGVRRLKNKPCVWTAHNLFTHDSNDELHDKRMIQKLLKVCNSVMVMSNASKLQLLDTYEIADCQIEVIPHGHFIDVYPNKISKEDARYKLSLESCEKVVLSLGRILPYKGFEKLIDNFCQVAKQGQALMIVGSCHEHLYIDKLRSLARKKCPVGCTVRVINQFIPNDELQVYFNAADGVALPFEKILNSGSLLLAMSFGKCVLAPRIGSLPEIAYPGGYYGYDLKDNHGLGKALQTFMNLDQRNIQRVEKETIAFVMEKYNWRLIGNKLCTLYSRIIKQ